MLGRDAAQLFLGRLGADASEEHAGLGLPALEVGPQQLRLLLVGNLRRSERLGPPAQSKLPFPRGSEISHPLRVPALSDEVATSVVGQDVDGYLPPFA